MALLTSFRYSHSNDGTIQHGEWEKKAEKYVCKGTIEADTSIESSRAKESKKKSVEKNLLVSHISVAISFSYVFPV